MQDKHEQLGEFGAIPGAPNGPPAVVVPQVSSLPEKTASGTLEIHHLARLFPPMNDTEFADLKSDIQQNGLREPLWTHQGKVIDGRNRLRACQELGLVPATREWDGVGSLMDFVISLNLHRRHLNETQRAMVAARLKQQLERMHFERSLQRKELDPSPNLGSGKTAAHAGQVLNVSKSSVEYATRVISKGSPELIALVDRSEIAVSKAATLATLPHSNQRDIISDGIPFALQIARELEEEVRDARRKKDRDAQLPDPPATLDFGLAEATRSGLYYRLEVGDDWPDILKRAATDWTGFDRAIDYGGVLIVKKKPNKDVA